MGRCVAVESVSLLASQVSFFGIATIFRFFECNYGDSGTPYDKIFGTFRDKLKESGTTYQGGSEEKVSNTCSPDDIQEDLHPYQVDEKSARVHDTKATLLGLPDASFVIYLGLNCIVWALVWKEAGTRQPYLNPHLLAALASVGPVGLAQLMVSTQDPPRPILYPFQRQAHQKEREADRKILIIFRDSVGTIALHLLLPLLLCIGPVYALVSVAQNFNSH